METTKGTKTQDRWIKLFNRHFEDKNTAHKCLFCVAWIPMADVTSV
jgi:hypothetical protein